MGRIDKVHSRPKVLQGRPVTAPQLSLRGGGPGDEASSPTTLVDLHEAINHFNLRSFDLNLMLVFDALMKERSVTKAAAKLRIQQPAMSHSLSTLRMLLQDELFVRVGQAMRPTPRALGLAEGISQVLAQAHQLLLTSQPFDPTKEDRIFRIGFSNELEVLLMPQLASHLHQHAPGIRVHARTASPEIVHQMLDDQVIDLAVGCYLEGSSRFRRKELFPQSLSCCYNPKLLTFPKGLTKESYLSARHALISQREEIEGCIDAALKRLNIHIDVAMAATEFLTVLTAAAHGPFVATVPTRIAKRYAAVFGLTVCDIPLKFEVAPIAMLWPGHADKEPAFAWLREQVCPVIADAQHL